MVRGGDDGGLIVRLPQSLVLEILGRLDLESLCAVAPVCKALRFSVSQALSTISTIDLSVSAPKSFFLTRFLLFFTRLAGITRWVSQSWNLCADSSLLCERDLWFCESSTQLNGTAILDSFIRFSDILDAFLIVSAQYCF